MPYYPQMIAPTGIAGGQTIIGGNAANDDLTLGGTSHATRTTSYVILQPSGGNVLIGYTADNGSSARLQVNGDIHSPFSLAIPYVKLGNMLQTPALVFMGDSRTFGSGGTHPWPDDVTPTDSGITYTKTNAAIGGLTCIQMVEYGFSAVDRLMSYYAQNIVLIWGGVNDFITGSTPEQVFQRIKGFCADRHRFGALVLVCTEPSITGWETQRLALNVLINAHWPEFADGLVDLGADATIGPNGASTNTTYYNTDGIHLKDPGYAIVSSLAQTAINRLIAGDRQQNNMFFTGSKGNIGIGTLTPLYGLDVNVAARFRAAYNAATTDVGVYAGYNVTPRILFGNGTSAQSWQIDNSSGTMRWIYGGSAVTLQLSSAAQLTVTGTNPFVSVTDTTATVGRNFAWQSTAGRLRLLDQAGSAEIFTVLQSGFVGSVGVTAPTALLHLAPSSATRAQLRFDPTSPTAPTSPNNGDFWFDGTDFKARVGGVTKTFTLT